MMIPTMIRKRGSMRAFCLRLAIVMCVWGLVAGSEPQSVGPCFISTSGPSFDCSGKSLTKIPTQIWDNVTVLDLSQNPLNLSQPETLRDLWRFEHLALLNLSGSYLPLLERGSLGALPLLRVLDLSSCHLSAIQLSAFKSFPKLQTLLLGNNRLRDPLPHALGDLTSLSFLDLRGNSQLRATPPAWLKRVPSVLWPRGHHDLGKSEGVLRINRKLLIDEDYTTAENTTFKEATDSTGSSSHPWYLAIILVTALTASALIIMAVKCKPFHRYLASYQHRLLFEGDTTSQCSRTGLATSFPQQDLTRQGPHGTFPKELEDDDGFIEDNYITASERERAEREVQEMDGECEDDDIQLTIG